MFFVAGTKEYVPDAETPDPNKQVLPGAIDNSGCSYEFRYAESREDVTVLNHTRVHITYKARGLKLRLQQTSAGTNKEWYHCFEMKDVDLPNPGFWGISSATGDLVDNHDIVQFIVRSLHDVDDPVKDYETWEQVEKNERASVLKEFDLRPPEALQRDYQRVLRAQATAIKSLTADVETLKQQLEFQLASIANGLSTTKKTLDDKSDAMGNMKERYKQTDEMHEQLRVHKTDLAQMHEAVKNAAGSGGWRFPFFVLFIMIVGLAGVGYNRYNKLYGKSHLP